jgi:hypothetical protein
MARRLLGIPTQQTQEVFMSRLFKALLASSLVAIGSSYLAADDSKNLSANGKAAEARKKGQAGNENAKLVDARNAEQKHRERPAGAPVSPATPAYLAKLPLIPATLMPR